MRMLSIIVTIFGGKLADLALVGGLRFFFSSLKRIMIGAPDVIMSTDCSRSQRMHQPGVGKENLSVNANSHQTTGRLRHEKAVPEPIELPRISLLSQALSPNFGKLLIVEGNIGVGKTTLTQKIAGELNYKLFLEPALENPFLGETYQQIYPSLALKTTKCFYPFFTCTERFYAEPHKYALKLQLWILNQRYLTYLNAVKHVMETGVCVYKPESVWSFM